MGDFPSHLVTAPARPRFGRFRASVIGVFVLGLCALLAGGAAAPALNSPAFLIAGMNEIPSPPQGTSWAAAPRESGGLRMVASSDGQKFELHTAGGDRTFLPGVDLGDTTPGHLPGEGAISAAQYRAWFAAMDWLGLRVVRVYQIHPPAFYEQLAAWNADNPERPLYLVQGVSLPDQTYVEKKNLFDKTVTTAFRQELQAAARVVTGDFRRTTVPGRAGGTWDTDVTPWLIGWVIGDEIDPAAAAASDERNADVPRFAGKYFRNTPKSTPTERWLAARMNDLAGYVAGHGVSQPIAFVNWPTTDPLRHPQEPLEQEDRLGIDANHVLPTADWPAGTFASYHAYPFYPDFLRNEPKLISYEYGGRLDPYAGYLADLRRHHPTMPTLITEFGVPSSIGSAHNAPLGRSQGDHSEQDAMQINADLLRMIRDQGLGAGFVFSWMDEWWRYTWNTAGTQDPGRRQLWHDPLTNEQAFGVLAMDADGQPDAANQQLFDGDGWPARDVDARVDEEYLNLKIKLGDSAPGTMMVNFDVLPGVTGAPMPGSADRRPDAVFALNLVGHSGQAYVRNQLDPMKLDFSVPASDRGPAPDGWKPIELVVSRALTDPKRGIKLPVELQNVGQIRYGSWDPAQDESDSRALWHLDGDDLTVRVPWSMLAFADPSAHRVAVPKDGKLTTQVSPGVTVSLTSSGTDQAIGQVKWPDWTRPYYTERLKQGAAKLRDAALATARND
ncbi:hypothetical protein KOI35_34060 [Actinoplanes bogorensis]|uniref:Uncharacterized protein n=1 Tax=Paractinoplanes bogorensis TaxID=1610840 RepID=A0ABS5Z2A4_9ACTN|nr:hypothetical protein [Actinoplanes bogorensis]MBU2668550.1 hypothetical protein [Actinoplanes bogorensis]